MVEITLHFNHHMVEITLNLNHQKVKKTLIFNHFCCIPSRSLRIFLNSHSGSSYGIRLSTSNYSIDSDIRSYPLYSVSRFSPQCLEQLHSLIWSQLCLYSETKRGRKQKNKRRKPYVSKNHNGVSGESFFCQNLYKRRGKGEKYSFLRLFASSLLSPSIFLYVSSTLRLFDSKPIKGF